jgi:formylglycine-generating enzyme required for sulfatase activity
MNGNLNKFWLAVAFSAVCSFCLLTSIFTDAQDDKFDDLRKKAQKMQASVNSVTVKKSVSQLPGMSPKQESRQQQPAATVKMPEIPGMVYVSSGDFIMGTNAGFEYEYPEHRINLKGFYIDKFEVTNSQYKKFVDGTGYPVPKHWVNKTFPKGEDNIPVSNVSYYDALAYAKWAGKRLPTEQEWEKTARGIDNRKYPWGNTWRKNFANVRPMVGFTSLKPVGACGGNDGASPYGAYDMAGNVWEWTETFFEPYPGNTLPNINFGKKNRVIKGGSYKQSETIAESYRRDFLDPNSTRTDVGFRCAK